MDPPQPSVSSDPTPLQSEECGELIVPISILDLPEEVIWHMAQFLSPNDIDACSNVCRQLRLVLNSDHLWKRHCIYSEKHFKGKSELRMQKLALNEDHKQWCRWRKYYKLQNNLFKNWKEGKFAIEKFDIACDVFYMEDFVDDYGNFWLFIKLTIGNLCIFDITGTPRLHYVIVQDLHPFPLKLHLFKDKLLSCNFNYADVYQFKPPEFELKLDYQFRFADDTTSDRELTSDDSDTSVKYCCALVDHFFLICSEEIVSIDEAILHVWDLESGLKVIRHKVFQRSAHDMCTSPNGVSGSLKMFGEHSKKVLLCFVPLGFIPYDLSLFSLEDMKIVKVIASVIGTIDCKMKGNLIAIYKQATSDFLLYNVNGHKLFYYKLQDNYFLSDNNWFLSKYKVILKVAKKKIHVASVIGPNEVCESDFNVHKEQYIKAFYDPNLLLMSRPYTGASELSVWDTDKGIKLWQCSLKNTHKSVNYYSLCNSAYPYKIIQISRCVNNNQIKIFNFEENVHEETQNVRRKGCTIYLANI